MRVVHVVRQFHPSIGGMEDAVLNVARHQRSGDAMDARVVTLNRLFSDPRRLLPPRETIAGVPVRRIAWRGSTRYPIAPAVLRHIAHADIVHVHGVDFFFDFLAWTQPVHRRRLVASTHGGFFHTSYMRRLKQAYFQVATRQSLKAYDALIACSKSDAEMFAEIGRGRVVTIENGADLGKFADAGSKTATRSLIYFGRLARHKRIDALLALLAALRRRCGEWRLMVAGSPGDIGWEELAGHSAPPGVRYVPAPTNEVLRIALGGASYYASASAHEGFGIAAVEGLSAGLVPVLSDIPPFRSLLGTTGMGIVIDPADPEATADRLEAWHRASAPDIETTRRHLMRTSHGFDWAAVAGLYTSLYRRLGDGSVRDAA